MVETVRVVYLVHLKRSIARNELARSNTLRSHGNLFSSGLNIHRQGRLIISMSGRDRLGGGKGFLGHPWIPYKTKSETSEPTGRAKNGGFLIGIKKPIGNGSQNDNEKWPG